MSDTHLSEYISGSKGSHYLYDTSMLNLQGLVPKIVNHIMYLKCLMDLKVETQDTKVCIGRGIKSSVEKHACQ